MIDYERDVKAFFAEKLASDLMGKGRIESAAYHTARHVYLKGVEDGLKAAGLDADAILDLVKFR